MRKPDGLKPEKPSQAVPVFEAAIQEVRDGYNETVTFEVEEQRPETYIHTVAISKFDQTQYSIKLDGGDPVYGPNPVPPCDPDSAHITWVPPRSYEQKMQVKIENNGNSFRDYTVKAIGWQY